MSCELQSLAFDALHPERLARFWSQILGREVGASGVTLEVPSDGGFQIAFVQRDEQKAGQGRVHFDLTSSTAAEQDSTVALALSLGASHLDVGQRPDEGHVVLADPEGNEFCVIEAANGFLADTARIGALSCDGTRAVGLFWSVALDWPLVWDHGEETAIQSPAGGTKIAWGGPPVAPKRGVERLRLQLAPARGSTQGREVSRLVRLGAKEVGVARDGAIMMADPDDNEFSVGEQRTH